MKLRFTPRAVANIADVADFLRSRNPQAATRVESEIYSSIQRLLLFPHIGRRQTTEGVRRLVIRQYSYLIYYTVDEAAEEIVVLNVKHPASRREFDDL